MVVLPVPVMVAGILVGYGGLVELHNIFKDDKARKQRCDKPMLGGWLSVNSNID
jgi:hypothetical protein